ncbi:MAG: zinc ABC transporter substrate-binding protein [Ruminiclostridium sp.]|nr:zinc ABC transporter substrate-binding protein [Ruminiclostridium sp.]
MLKKLLPLVLALVLTLTACGPASQEVSEDETFTLVTTTYPVYLLAKEVTRDVEGITVTCMINQGIGCLHDYTLSIHDMKILDRADLLALSGAGLEESMADAIAAAGCPQIDCSAGIALLESTHEHDHDHGEEAEEADDHDHEDEAEPEEDAHHHEDAAETDYDAHDHEHDNHIWMDPLRAGQMIQNLAEGLAQADPANARTYLANAAAAAELLAQAHGEISASLAELPCRDLITFHDGFAYFADTFGLTILRSMEEEAGSEASAHDVVEILEEIQIHALPAIFTEVNGGTATAEMIQRECGIPIYPLDMMMSGPTVDVNGIHTYLDRIIQNAETLQEAYS